VRGVSDEAFFPSTFFFSALSAVYGPRRAPRPPFSFPHTKITYGWVSISFMFIKKDPVHFRQLNIYHTHYFSDWCYYLLICLCFWRLRVNMHKKEEWNTVFGVNFFMNKSTISVFVKVMTLVCVWRLRFSVEWVYCRYNSPEWGYFPLNLPPPHVYRVFWRPIGAIGVPVGRPNFVEPHATRLDGST